jgi:hypothetical protein
VILEQAHTHTHTHTRAHLHVELGRVNVVPVVARIVDLLGRQLVKQIPTKAASTNVCCPELLQRRDLLLHTYT